MSMDPHRETAAESTLRRLIDRLPAPERQLLLGSATGAELGLSAARLSRLRGHTLGWLRAGLLCDRPPPWPDGDPGEDGPVVTVRAAAPGVIRVRVAGEIDRDNAGRLRQALLDVIHGAAAGSVVEVHLGAVPLLDAAGIAAVLAAHHAAQARDIELTLVALQPFVRRIALIGGLQPLLRPDDPETP